MASEFGNLLSLAGCWCSHAHELMRNVNNRVEKYAVKPLLQQTDVTNSYGTNILNSVVSS